MTTTTLPAAATTTSGRQWLRRIPLVLLLALTALLYLWSLSESGYANSFYSAAAQAGSQSWKAFFFGSLDAGNSITVDKPPASLWLMGLSVRLFGLSSTSILLPQALLGVATVGVVYAGVRRVCGYQAGLAAGAVTALTPSAALMFRFNNPDALLLLLLVLAGYCLLRAIERHGARWLMLAGWLVGLGFLTKMLQAFLVLPTFGLVYLIAAAVPLRKRLLHLLGALAAMIISLGWWVAAVEFWPKSSRPYIDGSTKNSVLELVFGYNGFGRLTGNETGQVGGGGFAGGGAGFGGSTGVLRLFRGVSGGMISWLIPAALLLMIIALVLIGRAPRTDRTRAALIIFGGSMITTALVFSFMAGIYHDYYTVALAPWIAGTLIISGTVVWRRRGLLLSRIALAAATVASTGWAFVLLGQSEEQPYDTLRWLVLASGAVATVGFVLLLRLPKTVGWIVLSLAGVALMTGPVSYTIDTVATPHTGSIVTAGPVSSLGGGGQPGGFGGKLPGGSGQGRQRPPGIPGNNAPRGGPAGGDRSAAPNGGMGGLLNGTAVGAELQRLLTADAGSYTWAAATDRAQNAASYQLATEQPVMAIGGFNGTTNSPTLQQFKADVSAGKIHYYLSSGTNGGGGMAGADGQDSATAIQSWVQRTFTARTVDGVTVYDLTSGN